MIETLLKSYRWFDHVEGPKFVETHRDAYRTSGHWLFLPGAVSIFHKVTNNEEIWAIHAGRLLVHVLLPDGRHELLKLGLDLEDGGRPVVTVPTGCWQAAELPAGEPFAFGTNVCAPGFSYDQFAIADRRELLAQFPAHRDLVLRLTRTTSAPAEGVKGKS